MLNRLHVILSAELKGHEPDDNKERTQSLDSYLSRCYSDVHDKVIGHYQGQSENSFIVQCKDHREVGDLFDKAQDYGQECIMLVDARGVGFLLYANRKMERLGHVTASEWLPEGLQNYTYNPVSHTYYYTL